MEKGCETCKYYGDVTKYADKCSLCTRRRRQVVLADNYEPALPEKHEGLTEQEALVMYNNGWEIRIDEILGVFSFQYGSGLTPPVSSRSVLTYKTTGRREGK